MHMYMYVYKSALPFAIFARIDWRQCRHGGNRWGMASGNDFVKRSNDIGA